MSRVIIFPRVSSDEQAKGYSLKTQETELRAYCEKKEHQIVAVFREDHSAKNFERPEFTRMLQFLKQNKGKVDKLLVTTWCRFSRNFELSVPMITRLRILGIEVQAIDQPLDLSIPENHMTLAFFLAMPDVDNRRRSIKIKAGVRAAKSEGRWLGHPPFGYVSVMGENNRKHLIHGEKAGIVLKAFTLVSKGKSQAEVRVLLKKEGVYFSSTTLSELLRSRVFIGEVQVKTDVPGQSISVKGLHKPIISQDLFNKVQDALRGKLIKKGFIKEKTDKPDYPLKGFLLCNCCGSLLRASASKGRNGYHAYYHCNECTGVRLRVEDVHNRIDAIVSEIKLNKNAEALYKAMMIKLLQNGNVKQDRPKARIEEELDQAKRRIQNLEDDFGRPENRCPVIQ